MNSKPWSGSSLWHCEDTGQSKRVADFLLAWHNATENGGWDPVDLWSLDAAIAEDILTTLQFIRRTHRYPGDLGQRFNADIQKVWTQWRG